MTAQTLLLLILAVAVTFDAAMLTRLIGEARRAKADHAVCIAHVATYTGDAFAARVLEAVAARYDSPEGRARMRELALSWDPNDEISAPAMWVLDYAEKIRKGKV